VTPEKKNKQKGGGREWGKTDQHEINVVKTKEGGTAVRAGKRRGGGGVKGHIGGRGSGHPCKGKETTKTREEGCFCQGKGAEKRGKETAKKRGNKKEKEKDETFALE